MQESQVKLYEIKGILRYSQNKGEFRCVAEVEQSLSNYYRSLMPSWLDVQRPRWPAHITVCRPGKEEPADMKIWGLYENEEVQLFYEPTIKQGKIYWWLDFYSVRLEEIRKEMGLYYVSRDFFCPEGFRKVFHMTIAHCKDESYEPLKNASYNNCQPD